MSKVNPVITIDGPAASGKSSVSRELSRRLGWNWLSSGAFYRGLAYVALQEGCAGNDVEKLVQLAQSDIWEVKMTPEKTQVHYRGQDVSDEIQKEAIGNMASQVSPHPQVRSVLLAGQRACALIGQGLVAEGRDCGSVVFPDAILKIFLTAHSQSRAERRAKEHGEDVAKIQEEQQIRDAQDSTRKAAPLQMAENAVLVDTSEMNFEEVSNRVHQLALQALK